MQRIEDTRTVPPSLVYSILGNVLHHLVRFKQHQLGVGVTVPMILDKERNRFILLPIGHQKSWGLWNEEYSSHDDDTSESLKDDWYLPRKIGIDVVAPVSDGGSRNRSPKIATVVEA